MFIKNKLSVQPNRETLNTRNISAGLPRSGKNKNFSRSGKSQGILQKVRENLSSCQSQWKVREKSGNFLGSNEWQPCWTWREEYRWSTEETEANVKVDLPVAYLVSRLMQGQWKLFSGQWKVREKSGNFLGSNEWQPCSGMLLSIACEKTKPQAISLCFCG